MTELKTLVATNRPTHKPKLEPQLINRMLVLIQSLEMKTAMLMKTIQTHSTNKGVTQDCRNL